MSGRSDALARLRALRQAGKTAFSSYEVKEAEDLYETVDEESYKKVVRKRLDQDDFVVDDNGQGYADDGREEDWEQRRQEYDSESEQEASGLGPRADKATKRKRDDDREKQEKIKNGINKYFNANAAHAVSKPKVCCSCKYSCRAVS